MTMIAVLIVFFFFTGWGVFGYAMHLSGDPDYYQFDRKMIPLMALFGLILGLVVYCVTKLFGLA